MPPRWHSRRRVHRKAPRRILQPERSSVWLERRRHGALRPSKGLGIDSSLLTYEACNAQCASDSSDGRARCDLGFDHCWCACLNALAALASEAARRAVSRCKICRPAQAHPDLPSQVVISARMKATQARSPFASRKKAKKVSAPHWQRGTGAIRRPQVCHRRADEIALHGTSSSPQVARSRRWFRADLLRRPSGGCIWSLTSSHLSSFRVVALSGLISYDCPISWATKMERD
jgi:hypothetical protein